MHLLVVGMDHRTAELTVRERCTWAAGEQGPAAAALVGGDVVEAVLLCTCNRTEVYAVALDPAAGVARITGVLAERAGTTPEAIRQRVFVHLGADDTLRHLCRVATGLESLVLGETQVLAQVKDAYQRSAEAGSVGKMLHGLFHQALLCSKRVHSETALASAPVSVGGAAVDFTLRTLGRLDGKRAVLLGAGETAEIVARRLREAGLGQLDVVNRTGGRAAELAAQVGGAGWDIGELTRVLREADVLITSTASERPVVTRDLAEAALAQREADRGLLIIDIAVPRDVDPSVAAVPGVRLCNIDDLEVVAAAGRVGRSGEVGEAEAIVEQEVARFAEWLRGCEVVPLVRALSERLEAVGASEVERALRRMPDLTPEEREVVRRLGRGIVRKVLDAPLRRIKELAGGGGPAAQDAVKALTYVFGLDLPTMVGLPGGGARRTPSGKGGTRRGPVHVGEAEGTAEARGTPS